MLSQSTLFGLAAATLASMAAIIRYSHDTLTISLGFATIAGAVSYYMLPQLIPVFILSNIVGKDVLKRDRPVLAETMGLPAAIIYLVAMFLFVPFPFMSFFNGTATLVYDEQPVAGVFPYHKLSEILSALLAIQSMALLGFADDVFDVRWRYKVWFPAIAAIPLLIVYYTNFGETSVMVPLQLRPYLGDLVEMGWLYYVFMLLCSVFCTHSINILAGINGLEAGQSLVIALSIAINDLLFIQDKQATSPAVETHLFSLYLMLPFIGVTAGLLWHNWYPARLFVGDTYCYFAGMTFAVVGILGHFTKTLMLFFIPQIFNFIYSAPQIFRFIECPRHRMPKYNPETNKLEPSMASLQKKPVGKLGKIILKLFSTFGLVRIIYNEQGEPTDCNNFTLINLVLVWFGPMNEGQTTAVILLIQGLCSCIGFFIRYKLVQYVY
ncbi:glycosyl transferase family 4-domain-containing protein [Umbelopsis sp. AD052]|nr:glycosyl transferase family 4-domain-containing protein [Umbelopsis sp. AD052]